MKKALRIGEAVLAIYGTLAVVGNFLMLSEYIKDKKRKEKDDGTVYKERGKTYFKVQDTDHETEPMGFHLG